MHFHILVLVLATLAYSPSLVSANLAPKAPISVPTDLFLLAGQSNMAGRGGDVSPDPSIPPSWDGIIPPQCSSDPRILRLNNNSLWEEAAEPLHECVDTTKAWGVGPGMPFANSVLARDQNIGVIGLVPCAEGGTSIDKWARGAFYYKRLINRANDATKTSGGRVRAMLWYQGESDCKNESKLEDVLAYKGKLDAFFTAVRSDLNLPMLPVIQVALASGGKYKNIIREFQLNNDLPNVLTLDANGLALEADHLHLKTASQVIVGENLADAFLNNFKNA